MADHPVTRAPDPSGFVLVERRCGSPVYRWQGESFALLNSRTLRPIYRNETTTDE